MTKIWIEPQLNNVYEVFEVTKTDKVVATIDRTDQYGDEPYILVTFSDDFVVGFHVSLSDDELIRRAENIRNLQTSPQ